MKYKFFLTYILSVILAFVLYFFVDKHTGFALALALIVLVLFRIHYENVRKRLLNEAMSVIEILDKHMAVGEIISFNQVVDLSADIGERNFENKVIIAALSCSRHIEEVVGFGGKVRFRRIAD